MKYGGHARIDVARSSAACWTSRCAAPYHRAALTIKRTAIVLGGSGSVGPALLRELLHDADFEAVITLSRRSIPEAVAMARTAGRTLVEKLVPEMKPAPLTAATLEAVRELDGDVEGFSVLGV